jgi:hypothetical protein
VTAKLYALREQRITQTLASYEFFIFAIDWLTLELNRRPPDPRTVEGTQQRWRLLEYRRARGIHRA